MALQNDTSRIQYNGNNSTTSSYAIPFVFFENAHIKCVVTSSANVDTTLALGSGFTVTGAGNANGGSLRTIAAVPTSSKVTIFREVPATQTTSYQEGGDFPAASHERALDKLTMIAQQTKRLADRALKVPETQNNPNDIPNAGSGQKLLGINDGTLTWEENRQLPVYPATAGTQALVTAGGGSSASWQTIPSIASGPITATGSTVPRFPADRFGERVNVKDFGAIGNGIANDTPAILAAAAALPNGGAIYFPPGIYLKDADQSSFTNISFVGEDRSRCIIKARALTTVTGMLFTSSGNNLTCRNLTLDCNWQNLRLHGRKIGAITLIGNNCRVDSCRVIKFGGCGSALQEAFPVIIAGNNAVISNNIVEEPVVGLDSNGQPEQGTYATYVNLFGTVNQSPVALTSTNATNNTLSVGFAYFNNGDRVRFNSLSGGLPLATNTDYYVVNTSGSNFQLALAPNGSPIDFASISSGVLGKTNYAGTAWITGNTLKGAYEEGVATNYGQANSFYEGSMGIIAGGAFDTLYVQNNHITNIAAGFNGDSWNNGCLIIDSNYFRNCQRCINCTFGIGGGVGSIGALRSMDSLRVTNNVFRVSSNALIGGVAGRFTDVKLVHISGNYLDTYDGTTASELGWFIIGDQQPVRAEIVDNIIHNNITFNGNEIGNNVAFVTARNNTDENGIQRFEYNRRDKSCVLRGNKSSASNGLELQRALIAANQSVPLGLARSSANMFTVYLDAGEYDLNSSNDGLNLNGQSHISIVGLSDRRSIRIKNSLGNTAGASSQSSNIRFKNLTIVGATGRSALQQSSSTTVFENIVFDKEGTGTLVPAGSWPQMGTFVNCYAEHPFVGSNGQGIFGGACYDCQWLGGFSSQQATGTSPRFEGCSITGGLFTFGASNLTMLNCYVTAATGASNYDMLLNTDCKLINCTFKNVRVCLNGTGHEIFNSTIEVDASYTDSISHGSPYGGTVNAASVKLFNVGSNKTVDPDITVTRLTAL